MIKALIDGWLKRPTTVGADPHRLYGTVVAAARDPRLYAQPGLPDTLDGRFEALILHAHALIAALQTHGAQGRAVAQEVFDFMLADIEAGMPEQGTGDQVVPKRLKKITRAFYGQAKRIDEWWDARGDETELATILRANVADLSEEGAGSFAAHLSGCHRRLRSLPFERLLEGFEPPNTSSDSRAA